VTLWHRLPWNLLFWLITSTLCVAALALSANVQMRRRGTQGIDKVADIRSGDEVQIVMVLNGDEVVLEKGGDRARLRMLGIHSFDPVVNEFEITAFGRATVSFLESWVLGKKARVVFGEPIKDVHGRYLGYLERDDIDINRRMVEEGISMVYTEFAFGREREYLSTEHLARAAKRGIWGGKKSSLRIQALRRQWAARRWERTGVRPPDGLGG
jgi:endonuclease YncB( thermonuclease family)